MIDENDLKKTKQQCYIVLSIIKVDKQIQNLAPVVTEDDMLLMQHYFVNQIAIKKGNYHFDTTVTFYVRSWIWP